MYVTNYKKQIIYFSYTKINNWCCEINNQKKKKKKKRILKKRYLMSNYNLTQLIFSYQKN
ncbi:hypothetical protein PFBG_05688 [Plasmodium falciparum 7G8]|uniref:Uncharacterized protein n=2 Tax=Plasmodium falciparum TaxID=5833 RepID=W7F409_PLAF8|nr:hypothetical protein PFNF135_05655 [Plasmodium falciparum NF135/5.C10]EUR62478.1 hypothetical protein PFBG_05688 [Plasmodium falciparum 7G8]